MPVSVDCAGVIRWTVRPIYNRPHSESLVSTQEDGVQRRRRSKGIEAMINVQAKPAAAAKPRSHRDCVLSGLFEHQTRVARHQPETGDQPGGARYHGGNG